MKKSLLTIITLTLMLFAMSVDCQAQKKNSKPNLKGTWVANDISSFIGEKMPPGSNVVLTLSFADAKNMSLAINLEMSMDDGGMKMELGINASVKGTYTISGDKNEELNLNKSAEKPTCDIYKLDLSLSPEQEAALAAAGMSADGIKNIFKTQFASQNPIESIDLDNEKLIITECTAKTLTLKDDKGQSISFTKK